MILHTSPSTSECSAHASDIKTTATIWLLCNNICRVIFLQLSTVALSWNVSDACFQCSQEATCGIVITLSLILFCFCSSVSFPALLIPCCAAANKSPLLRLGSDGSFPVWLRGVVMADLLASQPNIPCVLSKGELKFTFCTENCISTLFWLCWSLTEDMQPMWEGRSGYVLQAGPCLDLFP